MLSDSNLLSATPKIKLQCFNLESKKGKMHFQSHNLEGVTVLVRNKEGLQKKKI